MEDFKIWTVVLVAVGTGFVVGTLIGMKPKRPILAWTFVALAAAVLIVFAVWFSGSGELGGFAFIWAALAFVVGMGLKDEPSPSLPAAPHFHPEPKNRSRPRLETYNNRGELEHH